MDAVDYVLGAYPAAHVDDLVALGTGPVDLVFVLESPHTDELIAKHPVAGRTGRAALAILRDQPPGAESLGGVVKHNIKAGDARVAILNISTVPLQAKAFRKRTNITAPPLNAWGVLDDMRDAKKAHVAADPAAQAVAAALHADFQRRMRDVPMSAGCTVAVCGGFAHPFGRALSLTRNQTLIEIRHPSNKWWEKSTGQWEVNLELVTDLFRLSTR